MVGESVWNCKSCQKCMMHLNCAVEVSKANAPQRPRGSAGTAMPGAPGAVAPAPVKCPHCRTVETRLEWLRTDEEAFSRKKDKKAYAKDLAEAVQQVTGEDYTANPVDLDRWKKLIAAASKFC